VPFCKVDEMTTLQNRVSVLSGAKDKLSKQLEKVRYQSAVPPLRKGN
jgi:hypothetical protein